MDGQISFFDGSQPFKIDKPIRLIEFFAGIGAQARALERLGLPFERWKISEWDIYANCSYRAIHCPECDQEYGGDLTQKELARRLYELGISANGKTQLSLEQITRKGRDWCVGVYSNIVSTRNLCSITNIHAADLEISNTSEYLYFLTYSFPCQDLSLAGKRKGMEKGAGTRSGLLWEFERILQEQATSGGEMPQLLMMENVPQVCGGPNIPAFTAWLAQLERMGYKNYYKIQNATDCGIPQNRERCIMFSLYGDYYMDFPKPVPLTDCALDYMEDTVPQKYYIAPGDLVMVASRGDRTSGENTVCGGVCKNPIGKGLQRPGALRKPYLSLAGNLAGGKYETWLDTNLRVYDGSGVCPTLNTCAGGNLEAKILIRQNTKAGIIPLCGGGIVDLSFPNSNTRRGRVQGGGLICPTITTSGGLCRVQPRKRGGSA